MINRYSRGASLALAQRPGSRPEEAGKAIQSSWKSRPNAQFRPHTWPQPSSVGVRDMRCLICGVAFGEWLAEAPCWPSVQARRDPYVWSGATASTNFPRHEQWVRNFTSRLVSNDYEFANDFGERWVRVRHPNRCSRGYRSIRDRW